jgi:hypothetical protein
MTRTLSLRPWIRGALGGDDTNPLTPAYLFSALRIAINLTGQIVDAEELSDVGLVDGLHSLPLPFPLTTCLDWAECITVDLQSDDGLESASFSQGPDG